jgi:hypothetical protein
MSTQFGFVQQCVTRSARHTSNLPPASSTVQHLMNNIARKKDAKLLHLGADLSYALYKNNHVQTHWIDEEDSKYSVDAFDQGLSEYNLIFATENMFRTNLLSSIQDKLASSTLIVIFGGKKFDTSRIIERSAQKVPTLKITSKIEIYDSKNALGWGDGVIIYDTLNDTTRGKSNPLKPRTR